MSDMYQSIPDNIERELQDRNKNRVRVSRACDRCRFRKIKCSGTQPCASCIKFNQDCTFGIRYTSNVRVTEVAPNPLKRKLGELTPSSKPGETFGSRTIKDDDSSYINYLENRVRHLENMVFDTKSRESVGSIESDEDDTFRYSTRKWRVHRRPQNALTIELCESIYNELSPIAQSSVSIPRPQYLGWNMSGVKYLSRKDLPPVPSLNLPLPRHVYIDYYFKEINPLYSILHESMFKEQIKILDLESKDRGISSEEKDSEQNSNQLMYAILYLIIALSIRFAEFSDPNGPNLELLSVERQCFEFSHEVIRILSFEWESFELIQSLLLITLYLRVTHRQSSCFAALGQAITMTRGMGLNLYNIHLQNRKPYEVIKAKRIFWAVYIFDRLIGLQSGRHYALKDEDISVPMPSLDFEVEKDDWLSNFSLILIHIAHTAGLVQTFRPVSLSYVDCERVFVKVNQLEKYMYNNGITNDLTLENGYSALVNSQVLMNFYDLLLYFYGRQFFKLLGKKIDANFESYEPAMKTIESVLEVMHKIEESSLIYSPWFLNLVSLYNTGILSLVLINAGLSIHRNMKNFSESVRIINILAKPLDSEKYNKHIPRFTMANECLWALKLSNKFVSLRFSESLQDLKKIGVDPGSSTANRERFNVIGLINGHDHSKNDESHQVDINSLSAESDFHFPNGENLQEINFLDTNLLANLQWFDKFLDFEIP